MIFVRYIKFKAWLCSPLNLFLLLFFLQLVTFFSTNFIYCMDHAPTEGRLENIFGEIQKLNQEVEEKNSRIALLNKEASKLIKSGQCLTAKSSNPTDAVAAPKEPSKLNDVVGYKTTMTGRFLTPSESGSSGVVFRLDPDSVIRGEPSLNALQNRLGSFSKNQAVGSVVSSVESTFPFGEFPLDGRVMDLHLQQKQVSDSQVNETTVQSLRDDRYLDGAKYL